MSDLERKRRREHARRELRDHQQTCATCSPRKPCSIALAHADAIDRYRD
ncbi:MAG TPA: hypothetical protein VF761_16785 [Gemmatimonadaceae bacterium]